MRLVFLFNPPWLGAAVPFIAPLRLSAETSVMGAERYRCRCSTHGTISVVVPIALSYLPRSLNPSILRSLSNYLLFHYLDLHRPKRTRSRYDVSQQSSSNGVTTYLFQTQTTFRLRVFPFSGLTLSAAKSFHRHILGVKLTSNEQNER